MKEKIEELKQQINSQEDIFLQSIQNDLLQSLGISEEQSKTITEENILDVVFEQLKHLPDEALLKAKEPGKRIDYGKITIEEEELDQIQAQLYALQQQMNSSEQKNAREIELLEISISTLEYDRAESQFQLSDQQALLQNHTQCAFYQILNSKLSRLFLGLAVLDSKMVQGAENKVDKATRWASLAGGFIDFPFVPAAISFVLEVGQTVYRRHKDKQLEGAASVVTDLSSMQRLAERVARKVGLACSNCEKFNQLSLNAVSALAIEAYEGIFESLKHLGEIKNQPTEAAFIDMALRAGTHNRNLESNSPSVRYSSYEIFAEAKEQVKIMLASENQMVSAYTVPVISYYDNSNNNNPNINDQLSSSTQQTSGFQMTSEPVQEIINLRQEVNQLKSQLSQLQQQVDAILLWKQQIELPEPKESKKHHHFGFHRPE